MHSRRDAAALRLNHSEILSLIATDAEPSCNGTMIARALDEPIEAALRRFKKAVEKSGLRWELRRREGFISKSERRRIKSREARRRRES
jgi:ribosomal protein S21